MRLDGVWFDVLGDIQQGGVWLIYGDEKNGKTSLALQLANYLTGEYKVLYMSAEEGVEKTFTDACVRAGLEAKNKRFHAIEYENIEEFTARLKKRNSADIIFIDNVLSYEEQLKYGKAKEFIRTFRATKTIIFISHADGPDPLGATAKMIKRLAIPIFFVSGLSCIVSGRGIPGGSLVIDEKKAKIFHGENINNI